MTESDVTATYRNAFTPTEDNAVRRMLDFVETLPPAPPAELAGRGRWMVPAGVAAAVAAVAITTVTVATSGTHSAEPMSPGRAAPAATSSAVSPTSAVSPSLTPSPNPLSTPPTSRSPRSVTPTVATQPNSGHSAAATAQPPPVAGTTPAEAPMSTGASAAPTATGSSRLASPTPLRATAGAAKATGTTTATTYPALGDPGITGPLKPYANAAAYTKAPAGLAVRADADDIYSPDGVVAQFTMYITTPNPDPKVVVGGYLVMVAAPSIHYRSIDGEGPVTVPTGPALHLGDRTWRWNTDHTLLISTAADADIYIGVLATRAMNEFEPTIPTGYTAADIELIAAGIHV